MIKKKMLYLMHVDWNWIKQRPQFIEESLEKEYDITIFCPRNYRLKEYHDKDNTIVFYTIPFIRRFPVLWKIDEYRKRFLISRIIKKHLPDIIFCTSPEFSNCIPNKYLNTVVYDCMDDMLAFSTKEHLTKRVSRQERTLIKRANIIFATSERLKSILCSRYPESVSKMFLIRNGYGGNIVNCHPHTNNRLFTICYFGTISKWFDFSVVLNSLESFPDIQYLLIGPVEGGTIIPKHDRILYQPQVKHDELPSATEQADAFIMPFKLNNLILSVDPVKLYEYINFGKNILCVFYPEIQRFEPFVFFYQDQASFNDQIRKLKTLPCNKYNNQDRLSFLKENSWEQRAETIQSIISDFQQPSTQPNIPI